MVYNTLLGYHVKQLQQAIRVAMDKALHSLKLTSAQYIALSVLEATPGISSANVARLCFVTAPTMNDILQGLVKSELVERHAHPEHGRIVQLYLTEQGKTRLAQAHEQVAAVEQRVLAPLAQQDQQQLICWLQQCSAALETSD